MKEGEMAGKRGMKHCPEELKERVRLEYEGGEEDLELDDKALDIRTLDLGEDEED